MNISPKPGCYKFSLSMLAFFFYSFASMHLWFLGYNFELNL
jgi:hypothetical protein